MAHSKTDFSSNSLVYEMASLLNICGLCLWLYLASRSSKQVLSQNPIHGTVYIDGSASIATTDEDFICATLDWWPPDKCDYGTCSWGTASLLNLVSRSTSLSLHLSASMSWFSSAFAVAAAVFLFNGVGVCLFDMLLSSLLHFDKKATYINFLSFYS